MLMVYIQIIQKKNKNAKLVKVIKELNNDIEKYASKAENIYGSGGMKTKIEAAKICQLAGCHMVIANGSYNNPIKHIIKKKKMYLVYSKNF